MPKRCSTCHSPIKPPLTVGAGDSRGTGQVDIQLQPDTPAEVFEPEMALAPKPSEEFKNFQDLVDRVLALPKSEVDKLKADWKRKRSKKKGRTKMVISSLEAPFNVIKPISVIIRKIDDSFVASFEEANVNASGDTKDEAISNLRKYLIDLFDSLNTQQPNTLGPALKRDLESMKQYIRKR